VVASIPITNALITTSPIFSGRFTVCGGGPVLLLPSPEMSNVRFQQLGYWFKYLTPVCMALPNALVGGAPRRCVRHNSVDRFSRTSIFEMSVQGIRMR
jgi:hypothetical protein